MEWGLRTPRTHLRVDKLALVLAVIEALAIHLGEVLCHKPGSLIISITSAVCNSLVLDLQRPLRSARLIIPTSAIPTSKPCQTHSHEEEDLIREEFAFQLANNSVDAGA